jgi:hypothetical protein
MGSPHGGSVVPESDVDPESPMPSLPLAPSSDVLALDERWHAKHARPHDKRPARSGDDT